MKNLIELIRDYGKERESLGWLDGESHASEGSDDLDELREADARKQSKKVNAAWARICKALGLPCK